MTFIFKVSYESTVYENNRITYEPRICVFKDINKIKDTFGLSKEEIVDLYYGISQRTRVSDTVVKSIEKYTEPVEKEKRKFCVHFS